MKVIKKKELELMNLETSVL